MKSLALVRMLMGWIFSWAFIDKLFGLGFATAPEQAWLAGGSPTAGFLSNATKGPFVEFFQSLAGNAAVDWLFMLGLLGLGIALLLGIAMRPAAAAGATMMALMYLAGFLPPANNPVVDEHIIYAVLLVALASAGAGRTWGFGKAWAKMPLVKKYPFLR